MPNSRRTGTLKETSTASLARPNTSDHASDNLSLKTEAAIALGLWEKVRNEGWGALTAAESGSIGGYMTRMRFAAQRQHEESNRGGAHVLGSADDQTFSGERAGPH